MAVSSGFGYQVRTPENVTFEFELAGLGTRFLAWLIDAGVLLVGIVVLSIGFSLLSIFLGDFATSMMMISGFTWIWAYHIYFEYARGGATLGKKTLGIQVISEDGLPLDFWQALVRNLIRTVDFLSPIYLLGGTVAWASSKQQRLGDMVAGTIVVRKRQSVRPSEMMAPNERYNTLLEDQILAARLRRGIRADEKETLVSLCVRRNELELEARAELFRTASAVLKEKFGLTVDPHLSDERLVLNVTAALLGSAPKGARA